MMGWMIPADKTPMLGSSTALAIAAVASVCAALGSIAMWWQCRQRLNACLAEWRALKRSSNLLEIERQVVDCMNREAPLKEVLDILTRSIEEMTPQCLCSVLLLDDERHRLWEGSRGGLPEEYMRAVNGLVIGPEVGACGSAAFRTRRSLLKIFPPTPALRLSRTL